MSIQECATAAIQVFPSTILIPTRSGRYPLPVVMVAIAGPQSGWNPAIAGDPLGESGCTSCVPPDCHGYTSWGLWQIHNSTRTFLIAQTHSTEACVWAQWLYDPVHNAQAAYYLYQQQGLVGAWGGANGQWDTDAVQAALPAAQAAVQAALQAKSQSHPTAPTSGAKKSGSTSPTVHKPTGLTPLQWIAVGSGVVGLGVLGGWWWHTHPASFPRSIWARYHQ